jgi:tetratricopeptide (TPR) repeat protein
MNQMKIATVVLSVFLCGSAAPAAPGDSAGSPLAKINLGSGNAALKTYEDVAADSSQPDSVRMAAAGKRADAAFSLREFETARDYYQQAGAFEKVPGQYQYRYGLAALANGDTAEALAALSRVAGNDNGLAHESQVVLGEIALRRNDYRGALALFQKTGPFIPKNSWSVPAALGKLAAARGLGLADSVNVYEGLLARYEKTMLEKERFRQVRGQPPAAPKDSLAAAPAGRPAAAATGRHDSSFALQIGAFSTRERANALRKKLAAAFRDVACVPAVIDERTFYRVWVGDFPSRDEAESFARKKLTPQGYVYRVVEKE